MYLLREKEKNFGHSCELSKDNVLGDWLYTKFLVYFNSNAAIGTALGFSCIFFHGDGTDLRMPFWSSFGWYWYFVHQSLESGTVRNIYVASDIMDGGIVISREFKVYVD